MAAFTRMNASFSQNLRAMKASKKSGAGASQVFIPSFRHFEEMKFLLTTAQPRKGVSSATMSSSSSVLDFDSDEENYDFNNPSYKKRKTSVSSAKNITNSVSEDFMNKAMATLSALEKDSKMMNDSITGISIMVDSELRKLNEIECKEKIREVLAVFGY